MFSVSIINNSGASANLVPNGDLAGGVTRFINVSGYSLPIVIVEIGNQKFSGNPPHTWGVAIYDGNNTNFLGYEGNGNITIILGSNGQYTAKNNIGETISSTLLIAS